MVEFNLLPDVKLQFLKTKRLEHLVIVLSVIVGAVSLAVFIFLFVFVDVAQKVKLDNLTNEINTSSTKLESNKSLNEILTVQNQLETIPSLEAKAPAASRIFGFLAQLTPANASISSLNVDFTTNSITITGGADSLATVNTYVDTLKYATYTNATDHTKNNQAFNSVVLTSFNYSTSNSGANSTPAQYSIAFNFDPTLFNSSDNITLVVPNEITTWSILNQPVLFKANPTPASSTPS